MGLGGQLWGRRWAWEGFMGHKVGLGGSYGAGGGAGGQLWGRRWGWGAAMGHEVGLGGCYGARGLGRLWGRRWGCGAGDPLPNSTFCCSSQTTGAILGQKKVIFSTLRRAVKPPGSNRGRGLGCW